MGSLAGSRTVEVEGPHSRALLEFTLQRVRRAMPAAPDTLKRELQRGQHLNRGEWRPFACGGADLSASNPMNRVVVRLLLIALGGLLCVAPFVENYERIDLATGRLRTVYQLGPLALSGRIRETRFSTLAKSPNRADAAPQWRTVYSGSFCGVFNGGCCRSGGVPGDLDAFRRDHAGSRLCRLAVMPAGTGRDFAHNRSRSAESIDPNAGLNLRLGHVGAVIPSNHEVCL